MSTTQNLPSFLYTIVSSKYLTRIAALINLRDDLADDPLLLFNLSNQPLYNIVIWQIALHRDNPILIVSHYTLPLFIVHFHVVDFESYSGFVNIIQPHFL